MEEQSMKNDPGPRIHKLQRKLSPEKRTIGNTWAKCTIDEHTNLTGKQQQGLPSSGGLTKHGSKEQTSSNFKGLASGQSKATSAQAS